MISAYTRTAPCGAEEAGRRAENLRNIFLFNRSISLLFTSGGLALTWVASHLDRVHYDPLNWSIQELAPLQLAASPGALVIDARGGDAYSENGISGALRLSEDLWNEDLAIFLNEWRLERVVIVYCDNQSCGSSRRIALRLMRELPEVNIYILKGGLDAWKSYQAAIPLL